MKLPNANQAIVEQAKLVDYLLNPAHPDNGGKAAFFLAQGFTAAGWRLFASALRESVEKATAVRPTQSPHGVKYVVDAPLNTPNNNHPVVRTIWIIDHGFDTPRLVTAYPVTS